MAVENRDALAVRRPQLLIHLAGDKGETEQRVGADLLNEDDQSASKAGGGFNQPATSEKILGVTRRDEVAASVLDDGKVAVLRVLGHVVVDGGVARGQADNRVLSDVRHALTPVKDAPAVA